MGNCCFNCKFWEPIRETGFGYCDKADFDLNLIIVVHVSDDTGLVTKLKTGDGFGCILHEDGTHYSMISGDEDGQD